MLKLWHITGSYHKKKRKNIIEMNRSFSKIRHIQEANKKLEKRVIKEQDLPSTPDEPLAPLTNSNLPDCIRYIQTTTSDVVGGPVPGDTTPAERAPGESKILRGLDIEYFTDGGPEYRGIYLSKDGKRFCFTKV